MLNIPFWFFAHFLMLPFPLLCLITSIYLHKRNSRIWKNTIRTAVPPTHPSYRADLCRAPYLHSQWGSYWTAYEEWEEWKSKGPDPTTSLNNSNVQTWSISL